MDFAKGKTHDVVIASSGPDWLTATSRGLGPNTALTAWSNEVADWLEAGGALPGRWVGMGYKGWSRGPLRVGYRGDAEMIAILSGDPALVWSSKLPRASAGPTRFDLQTTILLDRPNPRLAEKLYLDLDVQNDTRKRKRSIKLIRSSGGDTCYIGRRSSAVYLRLYDKSRDV